MVKHIVFRIVAGLVLLAAIAGLGFFAYQAGIAHGAAANIQVPAADTTGSPYLYPGMPYGPFMWFPGFGFLGLLGLLIPLFLLCLAMKAFRFMFWGPRMGHMGGHGPWRGHWGENGVPPMFEEWHRKMHESPTTEK